MPSTSPHGRNADMTSATQASTFPSTVASSRLVGPPPFASARAQAAMNFSSALMTQDGSTEIARAAAAAWHLSLLLVFFAAALILAAVQREAGSVAPRAATIRNERAIRNANADFIRVLLCGTLYTGMPTVYGVTASARQAARRRTSPREYRDSAPACRARRRSHLPGPRPAPGTLPNYHST